MLRLARLPPLRPRLLLLGRLFERLVLLLPLPLGMWLPPLRF